jgi:hypothetical protein
MSISWGRLAEWSFNGISAFFWGEAFATNVGAIKSTCTRFSRVTKHDLLKDCGALAEAYGMDGQVELRQGTLEIRSSGSSIFSCYHKVIVLNKSVATLDRDAARWLMRREFCLLKDSSRVVLEGAVCVSSVAMCLLLPTGLNLAAGMAGDELLHYLFDGLIKREADSAACVQADEGGA